VGGIEDGHAPVAQFAHHVEDAAAALRVDADGRLVHEQQLGFVEQPGGDIDAPLHAAGVGLDLVLGPVAEADGLQHFVDAPRQLLAAHVVEAAPELQILPGSERVVEGDFLRHDADGPAHAQRVGEDGVAGNLGRAAGRLDEATEHVDGRRLARTVGAEQAEDFAGQYVEGDALDGFVVVERLAEIVGDEDGVGHMGL